MDSEKLLTGCHVLIQHKTLGSLEERECIGHPENLEFRWKTSHALSHK
jgi:hypothetical protein